MDADCPMSDSRRYYRSIFSRPALIVWLLRSASLTRSEKGIVMTSRNESDARRTVNLLRRRLLMGSTVVGIGGVAAAIHDGELGAPPQTFRGAVPWQEGTADAPPGVSGSGYIFFTPAEVELIEAAVGRLIPNDPVGPGAVE